MKAKSALFIVLLLLSFMSANLFAQEPGGRPPMPPDREQQNGSMPEGLRQAPPMQQMQAGNEQGQPNEGQFRKGHPGLPPIPNITKEQTEKIERINLDAEKKILPIKAEIRQKEAQLEALAITETPGLKEMDALIDGISALQGKIMKIHNAARQDIRKLLDDDQRTAFDSMPLPHPGAGPGPERH